jgi:hydroxypyruvate isomerase
MPKFAANLHYLFTEEVPFLDRFAAARPASRASSSVALLTIRRGLKARLDAHQLKMVLFDAPMGDWGG